MVNGFLYRRRIESYFMKSVLMNAYAGNGNALILISIILICKFIIE